MHTWEDFKFEGNKVSYDKDMLRTIVDMLLNDYPEAIVTINYLNTVRTTKSYTIVMKEISESVSFIDHLSINAGDKSFCVYPTYTEMKIGGNSIEELLFHHNCIRTSRGLTEQLLEECSDVHKLLMIATGILEDAHVRYDDGHELFWLMPDEFNNLVFDENKIHEVHVEGMFNGRPAYVGITCDGDFYVRSCNEKSDKELCEHLRSMKTDEAPTPVYTVDSLRRDVKTLLKVMEKDLFWEDWFMHFFPNGASSAEEVISRLEKGPDVSVRVIPECISTNREVQWADQIASAYRRGKLDAEFPSAKIIEETPYKVCIDFYR